MKSLSRDLLGSALFGIVVVGVFVGGGALWSLHAPLAGAVIAPGLVGFEGQRKTVQHLEGGIIKEMRVREGDRIAAGDTLVVLDDTVSRARSEELAHRIRALAGDEARLEAEREGRAQVAFTHPLLQDRDHPEVAAVIAQQQSLFAARATHLETRRAILQQRIEQLSRQADGVKKQLAGVRERLRLIREEKNDVAQLLEQGYARKPRLLAIQRAEAELGGSEGEMLSTLARNQEAMGEVQFQISSLATDLLEDVDGKLSRVHAERIGAEKLYREMQDKLARTTVVAPTSGIVLNVKFKTIGGVIQPGEPILEIAPVDDRLVVTAKVPPIDIEEVTAGAEATVVLPAYHARYQQPMRGEVMRVSADAFDDAVTRARYYTAIIEIDRKHLATVAPDLRLTAGMSAEVYIATRERTLAEFLIEPVRRTFARALRES